MHTIGKKKNCIWFFQLVTQGKAEIQSMKGTWHKGNFSILRWKKPFESVLWIGERFPTDSQQENGDHSPTATKNWIQPTPRNLEVDSSLRLSDKNPALPTTWFWLWYSPKQSIPPESPLRLLTYKSMWDNKCAFKLLSLWYFITQQ